MIRDALLQPVSQDQPCGPDLNLEMDPEFEDYYFAALGRLPAFYMQPGVVRPDKEGSRTPDRVFDPADVNIAAEAKAIESLLERSRDLRLLVLRAQWECLAGRLAPMAEVVQCIAALLETYPDQVHPQTAKGASDRRDAINDLNQPVVMVQAMQFAGLTGNTEVTLRKLRVAAGVSTALQHEVGLSTNALMDALGQPSYRKKADDAHAAVLTLLDGLSRIERACKMSPTAPFSPAFDDIRKVATAVLQSITDARPDLRGSDMTNLAEAAGTSDAESPTAPADMTEAPRPAALKLVAVVSQLHAKRLLEASEIYYRRHEPSSAALLLVTQARLLIGRPLVEAFETLLPKQAGQAIIDFGQQTGFQISYDRLKLLSESASELMAGAAPPTLGPSPDIQTAEAAVSAIRSVEDYFRKVERSSPVPALLQRARSYLDRDFQSLVDELIPRANKN